MSWPDSEQERAWLQADSLHEAVGTLAEKARAVDKSPEDAWYADQLEELLERHERRTVGAGEQGLVQGDRVRFVAASRISHPALQELEGEVGTVVDTGRPGGGGSKIQVKFDVNRSDKPGETWGVEPDRLERVGPDPRD